ncbi:hypothetical protein [Nonomuraea sp. NPDC049309]|uniref:hypothetical protein n=1 Tax=Nonomuraea sp. NPDC049309 TaxID=3364350 RepID=UPI00371052DE
MAVAVAVVLAALTACSSESPAAVPAGGQAGGSGSAVSPAADTASPVGAAALADAAAPTPALTGPCADGTCEIEVTAGDVVTVPERYGLGPIDVKAIRQESVEMVAPVTGMGFSIANCDGGGTVVSGGGGGVLMDCAKGVTATINDAMSLEVLKIDGDTAVVRIEPAG